MPGHNRPARGPRQFAGASKFAGDGKPVEDPADRLGAHEQPDVVLELPGPREVSDAHRVVTGVTDELLGEVSGALVGDIPVAGSDALFADLVEQRPEVSS